VGDSSTVTRVAATERLCGLEGGARLQWLRATDVELGDDRCKAWLNMEQSRAATPGLGWTSGEGAVGVDDRGNECGGVSSVRRRRWGSGGLRGG
jgi:hypothetical protein